MFQHTTIVSKKLSMLEPDTYYQSDKLRSYQPDIWLYGIDCRRRRLINGSIRQSNVSKHLLEQRPMRSKSSTRRIGDRGRKDICIRELRRASRSVSATTMFWQEHGNSQSAQAIQATNQLLSKKLTTWTKTFVRTMPGLASR